MQFYECGDAATVILAAESCPARNFCLAAKADDQATPAGALIVRIVEERSNVCFRAASRPSPGGAKRHFAPKQQTGPSAAVGHVCAFATVRFRVYFRAVNRHSVPYFGHLETIQGSLSGFRFAPLN